MSTRRIAMCAHHILDALVAAVLLGVGLRATLRRSLAYSLGNARRANPDRDWAKRARAPTASEASGPYRGATRRGPYRVSEEGAAPTGERPRAGLTARATASAAPTEAPAA